MIVRAKWSSKPSWAETLCLDFLLVCCMLLVNKGVEEVFHLGSSLRVSLFQQPFLWRKCHRWVPQKSLWWNGSVGSFRLDIFEELWSWQHPKKGDWSCLEGKTTGTKNFNKFLDGRFKSQYFQTNPSLRCCPCYSWVPPAFPSATWAEFLGASLLDAGKEQIFLCKQS